MARPRKISQSPLPSGFTSPEEVAAIVALCVQFGSYDVHIAEEFFRIFSRQISQAAIGRVRQQYAREIQARQLALIEDFEKNCPFSNSRAIQRLAYDLYTKAQNTVVKVYKRDGEIHEVRGINWDACTQLLKLAHRVAMDLRTTKDDSTLWTEEEDDSDEDDEYYKL
jgi:hypothetical protein